MTAAFCIAAFIGGVLVELLNSRITAAALEREGGLIAVLPLRAIAAGAFMVLVWYLSGLLGVDHAPPLIAAAVGASLGLVFFTSRLMRPKAEGAEAAQSASDEEHTVSSEEKEGEG